MLSKFEYLRPTDVDETCSLLAKHGKDAAILAGGTDLLVEMREGTKKPRFLIGVNLVRGLDNIKRTKNGSLMIGSRVTLRTLETAPDIPEEFRMIRHTASQMGSVQIRNAGTIGGNLCNGVPSADLPPVMLAMEAKLTIHGTKGQRTLPITEFLLGQGKTALERGEILTGITVPKPPPNAEMVFLKFGVRNAVEVSDLNICTILQLDGKGRCENVRIALGAVAPTAIRAKKAEAVLEEQRPEKDTLEKAAEIASQEISPRRRKEYKHSLTKALVRRALRQAIEKSRGM